jgi:hypothetical protein
LLAVKCQKSACCQVSFVHTLCVGCWSPILAGRNVHHSGIRAQCWALDAFRQLLIQLFFWGVNALQERSQATETTPQSSDKRMVQPGSHHSVKAQSDTPTTWSHGRHITVQSAKRQTPGPNHAPAK